MDCVFKCQGCGREAPARASESKITAFGTAFYLPFEWWSSYTTPEVTERFAVCSTDCFEKVHTQIGHQLQWKQTERGSKRAGDYKPVGRAACRWCKAVKAVCPAHALQQKRIEAAEAEAHAYNRGLRRA